MLLNRSLMDAQLLGNIFSAYPAIRSNQLIYFSPFFSQLFYLTACLTTCLTACLSVCLTIFFCRFFPGEKSNLYAPVHLRNDRLRESRLFTGINDFESPSPPGVNVAPQETCRRNFWITGARIMLPFQIL